MPRREDDVARGPALAGTRMLLQAGGFVLAVGATLAVFLTDNAQLLRVAVVAVAWAFVLATFAAGRRGTDRVRAAAREAELRRAYELELEREVAARREYELELENELRREAEDAMRDELDALRGEIASLTGLRDEVARVAGMRGDVAALGELRGEVARVAALRDDVAALAGLRAELGQLGALREDMGRLRVELAEQLSSEMLVERIVMRTQASRLDGSARTLEGATWSDDAPPRELTGGWPAIRLDEPRPTQQFEQVRTSTSTWSAVPPSVPAAPVPPPVRAAVPPPPVPGRPPAPSGFGRHERAAAHEDDPYLGSPAPRRDVAEPPVTVHSPVVAPPSTLPPSPPAAPPSPLEWLAARSFVEPPSPPRVDDAPRRRRTDEAVEPAPLAEFAPTTAQPAVTPTWAASQEPDRPATPVRLAQILAENGATPASGGRRRRRYREDGESDDVLARVLGR
ncbi:hypothetical protein QOZ88_15385 [Blastococcus sp. BMG 814]|uniref:DUF6779 domain-containing protein n=1 Tax=Blastococcus carthaginiensis TaxID=3050034 RepID=A0ABT9IEL5_9ACTN|nr:DUF6779 domain-containing protein [Blastococcus carthaginiensis]MDP5184020.1 hypothetical protein [Blastococcus carthaginiensis]